MDASGGVLQKMLQRWETLRRFTSEVIYGMTLHELELEVRRERRDLEDLLLLAIFGDMLGLPFFPRISPSGFCRMSYRHWKSGKGASLGRRTSASWWGESE